MLVPPPRRGEIVGELWEKKSGPRPYTEGSKGEDIAAGWAYTLSRGADERDVHVELTNIAALTTHLPDESSQAIGSEGWSAIVAHLRDDEPPALIVISVTGASPAD